MGSTQEQTHSGEGERDQEDAVGLDVFPAMHVLETQYSETQYSNACAKILRRES